MKHLVWVLSRVAVEIDEADPEAPSPFTLACVALGDGESSDRHKAAVVSSRLDCVEQRESDLPFKEWTESLI